MKKEKLEKVSYQEFVDNILVPEYINDVNLAQIEWINLTGPQLYKLIVENYIIEIEDKKIFMGNVDETKINECDSSPLGMKYLSMTNLDKDNINNYLIGIVDNKAGKKTIVAALTYEKESKKIYVNQSVPVTKISVVEVNAFYQKMNILKELCEEFINNVNKNQPIVMILVNSNEQAVNDDLTTYEILRQTALDKSFLNPVFLTDLENDNELRSMLCQDYIEQINR